jgi:cytoskeleton protein RodZ
MEEDDFAQLPGRTFIRGFVRNYARLLRLDVDAVLADLPEPELSPSLDRPSLAPTTRAMGEMPADLQPKRSASRWAIPLVLLAIIAAGIAYELTRPGSELALLLGVHRPGAERSGPVGASPTAVDPTPAVPLPNPIAPDSERGASNTAAPAGDGAAVPAAPVAAAAAPTEANADPALVLVFCIGVRRRRRGASYVSPNFCIEDRAPQISTQSGRSRPPARRSADEIDGDKRNARPRFWAFRNGRNVSFLGVYT